MSKPKTKAEIKQHKKNSIKKMDAYLDDLIDLQDNKSLSKADKLSYWLEDWITFLSFENRFNPRSLRRYEHGEIIKVHLGFNVGSEEGGLHYAVVVEKNNAKSSPVVTIVPLTSVKPTTDITNLHKGNIFLGNELFTILRTKISTVNQHFISELTLLNEMTKNTNDGVSAHRQLNVGIKIDSIKKDIELLDRMRTEIQKMKNGSIALVNQITTISKIRIYDPKTDHDILSNIKLSNEKLDLIDAEIIKNFTNS